MVTIPPIKMVMTGGWIIVYPSAGPRHLTAGFQKPIQVVLIKMIQGQIQTLQEIAWQVVNFVKGLDVSGQDLNNLNRR